MYLLAWLSYWLSIMWLENNLYFTVNLHFCFVFVTEEIVISLPNPTHNY